MTIISWIIEKAQHSLDFFDTLRQTHMGLPLNIFRLAFYWLWHVIRDVKI